MLLQIVEVLLDVLTVLVLVQAIMSFLIAFNVINTFNDTVRTIWNTLNRILDPIYRPIRRILPDFGAIDLSPLVVLLIIRIIRTIVLPYIEQLALGGPAT